VRDRGDEAHQRDHPELRREARVTAVAAFLKNGACGPRGIF
jgi:hypothetical protein